MRMLKSYHVWAREIGSKLSYCIYEFKAYSLEEAIKICKKWDCDSKPYRVN